MFYFVQHVSYIQRKNYVIMPYYNLNDTLNILNLNMITNIVIDIFL
jgi:hypothetical protein